MITIELPNPSVSILFSEYKSLEEKPGFYFMKNIDGKIIYIGEAKDVRKRLSNHYRGKSGTTKLFNHLFHYVDVFYCKADERKIYEIYAINKHNPPGNIGDNSNLSISELKIRRDKWVKSQE